MKKTQIMIGFYAQFTRRVVHVISIGGTLTFGTNKICSFHNLTWDLAGRFHIIFILIIFVVYSRINTRLLFVFKCSSPGMIFVASPATLTDICARLRAFLVWYVLQLTLSLCTLSKDQGQWWLCGLIHLWMRPLGSESHFPTFYPECLCCIHTDCWLLSTVKVARATSRLLCVATVNVGKVSDAKGHWPDFLL